MIYKGYRSKPKDLKGCKLCFTSKAKIGRQNNWDRLLLYLDILEKIRIYRISKARYTQDVQEDGLI